MTDRQDMRTIDFETVRKRYQRQAIARQESPSERLNGCLRQLVPGQDKVGVHGGHGRAYFSGLMVCGGPWNCPVCAARITEQRRRALQAFLDQSEYFPVMLTVTSAHHAHTDLKAQFQAMTAAWKGFRSGNAWVRYRMRYGIRHWVRAAEITFSVENGPHTHFHVLLLLNAELSHEAFKQCEAKSKERWLAVLDRVGLTASFEHGATVVAGNDAVAQYIAKFGHEPGRDTQQQIANDGWTLAHEITKAPVKVGRRDEKGILHYAPFELLDLIAGDDTDLAAWARRTWRAYEAATYGEYQIRASNNFPVKFSDCAEEESGPASEEEALLARLMTELDRSDWWALLRLQRLYKRAGRDVRAELLAIARHGDTDNLADWIADRLAESEEMRLETERQRESYLGAIESGKGAGGREEQIDRAPGDKLLAKAVQLRRAGWAPVAVTSKTGQIDQTDHEGEKS